MSFRFMRIMVFFDLPVETHAQREGYRKFRKALIGMGFVMMQESIYTKLVMNAIAGKTVKKNVACRAPAEGLVQMLTVTEKQFASMELIVGETRKEVIDSVDRVVIL